MEIGKGKSARSSERKKLKMWRRAQRPKNTQKHGNRTCRPTKRDEIMGTNLETGENRRTERRVSERRTEKG